MRKKRFPNITEWKCKGVTRKYCFETPLEHGEHRFLKIKYPATMPPLPQNLTGNTFDTIFGTNQSMLELFILKRKIKGPCWLTLTNVKKVPSDGNRSTWCRQELIVDSSKDVTCKPDDMNKQSPPLVSVVLSCKFTRSQ
jgi:DNA polymerase alpha subunit A